jgi:hypothetical protein
MLLTPPSRWGAPHDAGRGRGRLAYVLNDYEGGLPSARYVGIVADAAELAGAPEDYVAGLRARPGTSLGG